MLFLFDIDGVLCKSDYFTNQYSKDFDVPKEQFDSFFESEFNSTLSGESDLKSILIPHLTRWKWTQSVDDFLNYWFQYDIQIDADLILIISKLRKLGYKTGIASQQEKYRKNELLKVLKNHFDTFFFSCDLGFLKSQNEFYFQIKELHKEEIFFWDDTPTNIELANQNGINSYLYNSNEDLEHQLIQITEGNYAI